MDIVLALSVCLVVYLSVSLSVYLFVCKNFNPVPHMAILGSSNSVANTDMMSKIWTKGDTII